MFHPMAYHGADRAGRRDDSVVHFVPAALAIFLGGKISEKENLFMRCARRAYEPLLRRALAARGLVVTGAAVLIVLCAAGRVAHGQRVHPEPR